MHESYSSSLLFFFFFSFFFISLAHSENSLALWFQKIPLSNFVSDFVDRVCLPPKVRPCLTDSETVSYLSSEFRTKFRRTAYSCLGRSNPAKFQMIMYIYCTGSVNKLLCNIICWNIGSDNLADVYVQDETKYLFLLFFIFLYPSISILYPFHHLHVSSLFLNFMF